MSVQVHTQVQTDDMRMGPGPGPEHHYHRGDRLPPEARQSVMVVQDWRDHRLDPPPRGHDWVRLGSDFVLVAAATGIIAQVILSAGR
ncbi:MAG: RcnB family protein [Lautropia mirabilis]|nr:RcnB family protein [Lautropia mirabilis]